MRGGAPDSAQHLNATCAASAWRRGTSMAIVLIACGLTLPAGICLQARQGERWLLKDRPSQEEDWPQQKLKSF